MIFEVLSPSNGPQDRMARLADYSTVPSIEHSVVLHQDRPLATVHSRANLGVRMPLSAAYEDTPLDYFFQS